MAKKESTLIERIEKCEVSAKTIANPETRILKETDIPVGYHVWQGDLALLRLADVPANSKPQQNRTVRQLVEGNTRGSRHCVSMGSMADLSWFTSADKGVLVGDIISSSKSIEIEHPEHGNIVLPAGSYQVRYQRAYDPLKELKRQRD